MNLLSALGQALDFLVKAIKAYADTPEGQKEFEDVITALEGDNATQEPTATRSYRGQ